MPPRFVILAAAVLLRLPPPANAASCSDCPACLNGAPRDETCQLNCFDDSLFGYGVAYCTYGDNSDNSECFVGHCYGGDPPTSSPNVFECPSKYDPVSTCPPTPTVRPTPAPPPSTCPPTYNGKQYLQDGAGCYDESFYNYGVEWCYYKDGASCFNGLCYGSVPDGCPCDGTCNPSSSPTKSSAPTGSGICTNDPTWRCSADEDCNCNGGARRLSLRGTEPRKRGDPKRNLKPKKTGTPEPTPNPTAPETPSPCGCVAQTPLPTPDPTSTNNCVGGGLPCPPSNDGSECCFGCQNGNGRSAEFCKYGN